MDTIPLTVFLEMVRRVAQHTKITESAAMIVCLVIMLATISLLILLLSWLRIIIFLILFFRTTQLYSSPLIGGVQTLLHRLNTSERSSGQGLIVEVDDSDDTDLPTGCQEASMKELNSVDNCI